MRAPDPSRQSDPEKTGKCYCGCGESTGGHFHTGRCASTAKGKFLHLYYGSIAALLVAHGYGPDGVNLSEWHAKFYPLPPGRGLEAPVRSPDPSLRPDPEKTGECYCGCCKSTDGHFHTPGGDSPAMSKFQHLHYRSIAALLDEHCYGPDGDNLTERHAEKCKRSQCRYK